MDKEFSTTVRIFGVCQIISREDLAKSNEIAGEQAVKGAKRKAILIYRISLLMV